LTTTETTRAARQTGLRTWTIGIDGSPIFGPSPINPYTGRRYNIEEEDLSFVPDELDETGMNAQIRSDDDNCPFDARGAESELQGEIAVLGYTPAENPLECVQEYGICGYGRDISYPMFDLDPAEEGVYIYFVLHN
jgi:hypothetical protein